MQRNEEMIERGRHPDMDACPQEGRTPDKVLGGVSIPTTQISGSPEMCQANATNVANTRLGNSPFNLREQALLDHMAVQSDTATTSTAEASKNVLLVLVGLPGSGKSTFCGKMMQIQGQKWRRICQDVISNGKRGSKEQCLKHAEAALKQGFNVIIDRCNLNEEQRHAFLQLARRLGIEAEALVLNLPVKVCIQRAVQRVEHEGGLEGKTAAAAIQRMAHNKAQPSKSEGFSLIITCKTDDDIDKVFGLYQKSNSHCDLMNLLEKTDQGRLVKLNVQSNIHGNKKLLSGNEQGKRQSQMGIGETNGIDLVDNSMQEVVDLVNGKNKSAGGLSVSRPLDEGARTLAFPSISTSDFQFDHEKAADIIIERVSAFLDKYKHYALRLVLVDLKKNSDMMVRVCRRAAQCGLNSEQFFVLAGDISHLRSTCGVHCNFIANATNWRLKPGGGGVNAAIFGAAGEVLEVETKKRAKTLNPGTALVVPLPSTSPLCISEGVTHVIHVVGPNMNPQRPNCLNGDYVEGCKVLRNTYSCLFQAFASAVESQVPDEVNKKQIRQCYQFEGTTADTNQPKPRDAFALLMQSAKRRNANTSIEQKAKHGRTDADHRATQDPKDLLSSSVITCFSTSDNYERPGTGFTEGEDKHGTSSTTDHEKSKRWGSWAQGLRNMALHPEQHKDAVLQVTQEAVVITDKFPKGRKHLVVISKEDGLDSISELRSSHIPLLKHMHALGQAWAKSLLNKDTSLVFRFGYHSDPSMRQLHMHVISQDFESPCLKNKKHWNSFTTSFFCDSKYVIEELEKSGTVKPCGDESSLLKAELRCHRCRSVQPNMSKLKHHIQSCTVPFPSDLMQFGYFITADNEM